ncbi:MULTISPECIES: hypothetical protein [Lactococcus]|uniref:hypothetical protein n=1 Tax=Lactococcus TaxID=1357 RepID=UPI001CC20088|nr:MULTISPECIES: hypothetical protein [Lactococcus]
MKTYFNVPSDAAGQEKNQVLLSAFYGQALPIAAQGQQKNTSQLTASELLHFTDSSATYLVSYTTTTQKTIPASKGKKASVQKSSNTTNTLFKVPYAKVGEKYYVSSFPTFEDITALNAGKAAPLLSLDAMTNLSKSKENQLNAFVKSLLEAKTKNKESLDLLSKGLGLSTSEELASIDYTNYKSVGKDKYKAVIQATFKNSLGTHPENYVFTIEKINNTYFARDFSNVITAKDMETTKG